VNPVPGAEKFSLLPTIDLAYFFNQKFEETHKNQGGKNANSD